MQGHLVLLSDLRGQSLGVVYLARGRQEIERLVKWARSRNKYEDFCKQATAFLADDGLPFKETPPTPAQ